MNLIALTPTWLIAVLCAVLGAAAVEDLVRLRISNVIVVLVAVTALAAAGLQGWSLDLWQNLVVSMALLFGGTFLFATGKVGGGDVKLLAATGLWVDFQRALVLLPAIFIAGGLLAMLVLSRRMLLRAAGGPGDFSRNKGVPYGVAVAVGIFFLVGLQTRLTLARHEQLTKALASLTVPKQ